ncbi:MAG: sugar phosphate isomerase/epimerase [Verrucomicrobia bacterium]|nr:sugar phosphate isomerase/epimerase [Verrucomicrobiota bacterium]
MESLDTPKRGWRAARRPATWRALLLGSVLLLHGGASAAEISDRGPNPFFAMDNGVGRGRLTPVEQAEVVKDIGFDGISYNGTQELTERLNAFDQAGLKIFGIYVHASFEKPPREDKGLAEAILKLKGRDTVVWLTVGRLDKGEDADAVRVVREVADMAAASGVRVALYPHRGDHVETTEDALRIVEQVGRPNVGVTFNLCHELMAGNEQRLETILRTSASKLYMVTINGADPGTNVEQTIQVLGEGRVDVLKLLKVLDAEGYLGPIGLQCYNVKGDMKENLTRSMEAWKQMSRARVP